MKLITDNAALAKAIKSIAVRGQKLDHDIHVAGTSCLQHIANHSDTTLLNDLVNALPKGARKHAFVEWALAYGNVSLLDKSLDGDKDKIERGQVFKLDRTKSFDLEGAVANAWYNFKPEADLLTAFDVHKAVAQLVKRVTKATKDGATLEGVQDALKQLKALEQQLNTVSEEL